MTKKFIDTTDKAKAKDSDEESKDEQPELTHSQIMEQIAVAENTAALAELHLLHEHDSKDRRHERAERAPDGLKLSDFKKVMGQKVSPKVISKTKREFYPYTALAKASGKYMKRSVLMFHLSRK